MLIHGLCTLQHHHIVLGYPFSKDALGELKSTLLELSIHISEVQALRSPFKVQPVVGFDVVNQHFSIQKGVVVVIRLYDESVVYRVVD